MHLQYQIYLLDYDWVVLASWHKLILSVSIIFGAKGLVKPGEVGFSGQTYIAIRSG